MEIDLGLLFGYYLGNMRGLSFDEYVEKYEKYEDFRKSVHEEVLKYKPNEVNCDD